MHVSRDPVPRVLGTVAEPLSTDRLFQTPTHQEVLSELSHALSRAPGIAALTGEAGLGKSTLARQAVSGWPGPVRTVAEGGAALTDAVAALRRQRRGRTPGVLIVDGAHALPPEAFALLGSLDARTMPHVVLVGQSELWGRLQDPGAAALRDRIHPRCVLFPLPYGEAERYVEHVFRLAGAAPDQFLGDRDRHAMLLAARGNIRRINADLLALLARNPVRAAGPAVGRVLPPGRWSRVARAVTGVAAACVVVGGCLFVLAPELLPDVAVVPLRTAVTVAPSVPEAVPDRLVSVALPPAALPLPHPPAARPDPFPEPAPAARLEPAPQPAPEPAPESVLEPAPQPAPQPQAEPRPAPAAVLSAVPVPPPPGTLPDEVVAVLVRRGEAMMELHDVSAARQFFERAALEGSGPLRIRAALGFAASYDPGENGPGASVEDTDAGVALAWYRLAASLGSGEARAAVKRLSGAAR